MAYPTVLCKNRARLIHLRRWDGTMIPNIWPSNFLSRRDLFRWTPRGMVIASSTNFVRYMQTRWVGSPQMCVVEFQHLWLLCFAFRPGLLLSKKPYAVTESEVMSWVQHRSKPLMTTTTTIDTCLVHQTEAQINHCAVGKSEMCPAWLDLQCSDYHVFNEIMVNVPFWTKMIAQMHTTQILSDTFKYMAVGLFGCRDLLLSKKPCAVAESEVNARWKLDWSQLTTMTWLRLEILVQWW